MGQKIQVEIGEIDDRGKLSLVPVVEESAQAADGADGAAPVTEVPAVTEAPAE